MIRLIIGILILSTPLSGDLVCRAAFDIGSGSIKYLVATVNTETENIEEVLDADSILTPFSADVSQHGFLGEHLEKEAVQTLLNFKIRAERLGAQEFTGVATAAFRAASNGTAFIARLQEQTGIELSIISTEQEGYLGLLSAALKVGLSLDQIVVYDIGAGSFQISAMTPELTVYSAPFGRLTIVTLINQFKKSPQNNPNPIDPFLYHQTLTSLITQLPPLHPKLVEAVATRPLIGVSAHSKVVRFKTPYQRHHVQTAIQARIGKEEETFTTDLPQLELSDLILMEGIMTRFGLNEVQYVSLDAGLTAGLLVGGLEHATTP